LEGPITNAEHKIIKVGRHIKFSPDIENGLKKMNIDILSLANNHIMDYGSKGYQETISTLDKIGIDYIGCSSKKYSILDKANVKVALLSFSNKEFSLIADFQGEGSYPIDLIDILETIERVKKETENIIIQLHTGLSGFPYPSPDQKRTCRFLIDQGVSSVLCQHSHTIGAYEHYKDGFISYGQGSFVFDLNKRKSFWNKGYSVIHNFKENKSNSFEIIPHYQFDDILKVRLPYKEERRLIENELIKYNKILSKPSEYNKNWIEFVDSQEKSYFREYYLGKNRILRKLFAKKKFNFSNLMPLNKKKLLLNFLRNDEHKEVLIQILKDK